MSAARAHAAPAPAPSVPWRTPLVTLDSIASLAHLVFFNVPVCALYLLSRAAALPRFQSVVHAASPHVPAVFERVLLNLPQVAHSQATALSVLDALAALYVFCSALTALSDAWRNGFFPFSCALPGSRDRRAWWARQVVVVTGGSGGLGAALVHEALRRGAYAVFSLDIAPPPPSLEDRDLARGDVLDGQLLKALATEAAQNTQGGAKGKKDGSKSRGHFFHISCDLSSRAAIDGAAERVRAYLTALSRVSASSATSKSDAPSPGSELRQPLPVSLLLNCAGVHSGRGQSACTAAPHLIERAFAVNALASFWTARAFLPGLLRAVDPAFRRAGVSAPRSGAAAGGKLGTAHIVHVSSIMAHVGLPRVADYCASKHALLGFHESLRRELDAGVAVAEAPGSGATQHRALQRRVRTTLVTLGRLQTPLFADLSYPRVAEAVAPTVSPESVAKLIVRDALEREASAFIYAPLYARFAPLLPLLPSFVQDAAVWATGADKAMD